MRRALLAAGLTWPLAALALPPAGPPTWDRLPDAARPVTLAECDTQGHGAARAAVNQRAQRALPATRGRVLVWATWERWCYYGRAR